VRRRRALRLALLLTACLTWGGAWAAEDAPPAAEKALPVRMIYLGKEYTEPLPLSLVEKIATDKGIRGARIALEENNRTGRFLSQDYQLGETIVKADASVAAAARTLLAGGPAVIIADLEASDLLEVAALPEAAGAVILDIRTSDDDLRQENCRANVFHILPSRSMRADALGQYLLWKKWRRWLLIKGSKPKDEAYAAAVRRAASRFGAKIVEERTYSFDAGSRRTDTGHQQIQTQMPMLTQGAPDYDVLFAADEEETFGEYLLFRTMEPRPVVGTHGLIATAWHRSFEEFAATQMQNRFERVTSRIMTERDYSGWLAVRIVGEAATRTGKAEPADIKAYMRSDVFEVAGFKGQGLTFRRWDQQLRQPVILAGPRAMISLSPQEGFLHPKFLTDTLGFDEPETKCRMKK
jgi:ABC transporter substrate binding protein (PQQ-dependent alcohol dehydrogenase system)